MTEFWLFHLPLQHLIGIFACSVRQIPDAIENRHNSTVVVGIEVLKANNDQFSVGHDLVL